VDQADFGEPRSSDFGPEVAHTDDPLLAGSRAGRHPDDCRADPFGYVVVENRARGRKSRLVRIQSTEIGQYPAVGGPRKLRAIDHHFVAVSGSRRGLVCFLDRPLPRFWTHLEVKQLLTKEGVWTPRDRELWVERVFTRERDEAGARYDALSWSEKDRFYDSCVVKADREMQAAQPPKRTTAVVATPKTDGLEELRGKYGLLEEVTKHWLGKASRSDDHQLRSWAAGWKEQEDNRVRREMHEEEEERRKKLREAREFLRRIR
jgi:hypothetical protein